MRTKWKKIFSLAYNVWEAFLRLLFPPRCLGCGCFTGKSALCSYCIDRYDHDRMGLCPNCYYPLYDCRCQLHEFSGERLYQVTGYHTGQREELASILLYALKKGERDTVLLIGTDLSNTLLDLPNYASYTVTWVPRRRSAIQKYGCDQSRLLAREVARQLGIPCRKLVRRIGGEEQKKLTQLGRKKNAAASFAVVKSIEKRQKSGRSKGKQMPEQIILIDDLATTGSTLAACARLLHGAGAKKVVPAVFARTVRKTAF